MFAWVAAVISLGEQLRGKRAALGLGKDTATGALIVAPSRVLAVLALIESFCVCVAQLSALCFVERISSKENPAGAPGGSRLLFRGRRVFGELASLRMDLQLCCRFLRSTPI